MGAHHLDHSSWKEKIDITTSFVFKTWASISEEVFELFDEKLPNLVAKYWSKYWSKILKELPTPVQIPIKNFADYIQKLPNPVKKLSKNGLYFGPDKKVLLMSDKGLVLKSFVNIYSYFKEKWLSSLFLSDPWAALRDSELMSLLKELQTDNKNLTPEQKESLTKIKQEATALRFLLFPHVFWYPWVDFEYEDSFTPTNLEKIIGTNDPKNCNVVFDLFTKDSELTRPYMPLIEALKKNENVIKTKITYGDVKNPCYKPFVVPNPMIYLPVNSLKPLTYLDASVTPQYVMKYTVHEYVHAATYHDDFEKLVELREFRLSYMDYINKSWLDKDYAQKNTNEFVAEFYSDWNLQNKVKQYDNWKTFNTFKYIFEDTFWLPVVDLPDPWYSTYDIINSTKLLELFHTSK